MPVTEVAQPGETRRDDYSLHGLARVRLLGAPESARAELARRLGPPQGESLPAGAEPDVTIRYVPRLPRPEGLQYVGLHEAAFDAEQFYLVGPEGQLATFPFERLGEPLESVCEHGVGIGHYLLPALGLRLLRRGLVLLHASSFVHEGVGVLVPGWQKGGKTETLLAFMRAGAQYLADEWTILAPDKGLMWGLPGTTQVWDWHFRQLPELWRRLPPRDRNRLRFMRLYQRLYRLLPAGWQGRGPGGHLWQRLSLDGRNAPWGETRSAPERLFAGNVWRGPAPVDVVLLAGLGPAVRLAPLAPEEVAARMAVSLTFERDLLNTLYQHYRFAFPGRRQELLERAAELEEAYLRQALAGLPAYRLLHPYPVALSSLYEACLPAVSQAAAARQGRSTLATEVLPR